MRTWLGMTTTTCVQLEKQNARGRVRYGRERREELLGEFGRSGMSAAVFARLSGVRYTTFAGWVQRCKQEAKRDGVAAVEEERRGPIRLLEALVCERLREDLRKGALFVFTNRSHSRLKIIYWDGSGLWVLVKRLERGTFAWPRNVEAGTIKMKLAPEALAMLTDGIDLRGARLRPWYERE